MKCLASLRAKTVYYTDHGSFWYPHPTPVSELTRLYSIVLMGNPLSNTLMAVWQMNPLPAGNLRREPVVRFYTAGQMDQT